MVEVGLIGRFERNGPATENHTISVHFELGEKPNGAEHKGKVFIPLDEKRAERIRLFVHSLAAERKADPFDISNPNELPSHIELTVLPSERKIQWFQFFPFGRGEGRPLRSGIGTLMHRAITEWLAKQPHHTGFVVGHDRLASDSRKSQLRKMEIDPAKSYPIEEYRELVRAYVEKKFGKGVKVHLL